MTMTRVVLVKHMLKYTAPQIGPHPGLHGTLLRSKAKLPNSDQKNLLSTSIYSGNAFTSLYRSQELFILYFYKSKNYYIKLYTYIYI